MMVVNFVAKPHAAAVDGLCLGALRRAPLPPAPQPNMIGAPTEAYTQRLSDTFEL